MHTLFPATCESGSISARFSSMVRPCSLKAALLRLASALGLESEDQSIRVSLLPLDMAAAGYLVTLTEGCARELAEEVGRLTGRLLLPQQRTWVLFQHEAQLIVSYLGCALSAR